MNRIAQAWRRVPTVSAKFLLILLPSLVLGISLLSAIFFQERHRDLRAALHDKIAAIADSNAVALSAGLWSFDTAAVRAVVHAIAANRELVCVELSDDLADTRSVWPETGCPSGPDIQSIHRPILAEDLRVGTVTLRYGPESVRAQLRQEVLNAVVLLLLMLAGTVAAALAALRLTVGRPLHRLVAAIRDAERGEHRPVAWASADEMGRVILAHNGMLARLGEERAALRQSEQRLALAIAATHASVWDYDLRSGHYWWSEEFPALLGYAPGELAMTAAAWAALLHPDEAAEIVALSRRRMDDTATVRTAVYRMRRRDGRWAWIEDRATAQRDADGTVRRLTGTMTDVTERVRTEMELAHERNTLQITLDNTDQGIIKVDRDLRVVMSNRRAAELLNVPPEALAANPGLPEIVALQRDRGEFDAVADDPDLHLAREATGGALFDRPSTFKRRRPDGRIVELRTNPLPEGGFVRTFTDVTVEARSAEEIFHAMQALELAYADLKETQAHLVQAEKMASLAMLVAGVAHEINTPIGIAFGCATHLSGRTRTLNEAFAGGTMKKSDLAAYVAAAGDASALIQQNLTRAADLIQSFKRVAVDQTSEERRRFDLLAYLEEIVTSLGPSLRQETLQVVVACPPGIAMDSFPGALSQLVTNLVMNALIHAFPDGRRGRLLIDVDDRPDGEVEIRFADDGAGIAPENLPHVFEPFFTTRRGSGGSGLGLHIAFNLATQTLGGRISVDSTPGDGTTFTLRLPRTASGGQGAGARGVETEPA